MGVSSRHARPVPRAPLRWRRNRSAGVCESCALTIVGTVRDAQVVGHRGRWKRLCARGANPALLRGRSTSPLGVMTERASAWYPVPDLTDGFRSISFSYQDEDSRGALVVMNGARKLSLEFTRVIAFHFEDDCPGNFPLPRELPKLRPGLTFPLLKIENSRWLSQWPMWPDLAHYVLLSL